MKSDDKELMLNGLYRIRDGDIYRHADDKSIFALALIYIIEKLDNTPPPQQSQGEE